MALIRIGDVEIGMELASDIVDEYERVMLRAGVTVSERELRLLKMWGIGELDVVTADGDSDQTESPSLDPTLVAEHEPRAREMFRHTDLSHPAMKQLFNECIVRLAARGRQVTHNDS